MFSDGISPGGDFTEFSKKYALLLFVFTKFSLSHINKIELPHEFMRKNENVFNIVVNLLKKFQIAGDVL